MNKNEEIRTEQLLLRIYSHVAGSLLRGKTKDAYHISTTMIETNKGRRNKALRLLEPYIKYIGTKTNKTIYGSTSSEIIYDIQMFATESQRLAVKPEFMTTWENFHSLIYEHHKAHNQDTFDLIGYKTFSQIKIEGILYIYWHQDEYSIIESNEDFYAYPKEHTYTRIQNILRAIVEQEYQDGFITKIECYLGLKPESLKREQTFNIKVRNFCSLAGDFSSEQYFGKNGFRDEYSHYKNYFEALLINLKRLDELIQSKGGQEAITREIRKNTIKELIEEAPLRINREVDESILWFDEKEEKRMYQKYASVFILRNSNLFDYNILFGLDESIQYIIDNSVHRITKDNTRTFVPDKAEVQVIILSKKE